MLLTDAFKLAFRAVIAQPLRSFLTLLGIAIGIAAVILLTSIGEGIHRYVLDEFTQFGTNVIGVHPGKVKTGGAALSGLPSSAKPLSLEDAEALMRLPNVVAVTPSVLSHSHTWVPSCSIARILYPPPGQTTTAVPLDFSGLNTVMVGSETSVTRRTSAGFLGSICFSGPMATPGFSGAP